MTNANETSGFGQFVAEMRRRHVVRFALGYSAAAFVVLQLAEIVFPAFGIGEGGLRLLVVVTGLGFPPALVLAWMFDLTTEGIQRTDGAETTSPLLPRLALGTLLLATLAIVGALGLYLSQQGVFDNAPVTADVARTPVRLAEYDPETPIRSIAVLPLDDFSPGGDQAYFAASMHEELIAKLSSLEQIRVVSRTSSMRYAQSTLTIPQIGRDLDVDVIVEGSVSRTADRTRVTLQLIHAPSDSHIQTLQWDREDVGDVLSFQTEIAHEVVEAVALKHEEGTIFRQTADAVDPAAQDAYFRGRYELDRGTPEGYRAAVALFGDALEAEPDFAAARVGMAGARFLIGVEDAELTAEELSAAREEALAALELDSSSLEAMDVLSVIERSTSRIMGTAPTPAAPTSEPKVVHFFADGGGGDSIMIDMHAFDTAWVSAVTSLGERIESRVRQGTFGLPDADAGRSVLEARQLLSSGRYSEAARRLERVVENTPEADQAWEMLARAHASAGEPLDAVETVEAWSQAGGPRAPTRSEASALQTAISNNGVGGYWSWNLARLEGLRSRGLPVANMDLATTHAALGHTDQALEHLVAALEAGEPGVLGLRSDPIWDELRANPRMREVIRQAQSMRYSGARRPPRNDGR